MNLLLLLSALLSALTGATGGRAPAAQQAISRVEQVAQHVAERVAGAPARPVAALPPLRDVAHAAGPVAWRLPAAVPAFLSRLRQ